MAGRGSETSRSEATWRDVNQPKACQPETDQPETSRPEASWPKTSRRDAPRRDTPSYDTARRDRDTWRMGRGVLWRRFTIQEPARGIRGA